MKAQKLPKNIKIKFCLNTIWQNLEKMVFQKKLILFARLATKNSVLFTL